MALLRASRRRLAMTHKAVPTIMSREIDKQATHAGPNEAAAAAPTARASSETGTHVREDAVPEPEPPMEDLLSFYKVEYNVHYGQTNPVHMGNVRVRMDWMLATPAAWRPVTVKKERWRHVRATLPAVLTIDTVRQLLKLLDSLGALEVLEIHCEAATNVELFLRNALVLKQVALLKIKGLAPSAVVPLKLMKKREAQPLVVFKDHHRMIGRPGVFVNQMHGSYGGDSETLKLDFAPFVNAFQATGTVVDRVALQYGHIHLNSLWSILDTNQTAKITLQDSTLHCEDNDLLYRLENAQLTLNKFRVSCGDPSRNGYDSLLSPKFLQTLQLLELRKCCFLPTSLMKNLMSSPIATVVVELYKFSKGSDLVFPAMADSATNTTLTTMALAHCKLIDASSLSCFRGLEYLKVHQCEEQNGPSMADWTSILSSPRLRTLVVLQWSTSRDTLPARNALLARIHGALLVVLTTHDDKTLDRLELEIHGDAPTDTERAVLAACRSSKVTCLALRLIPGKAVKRLLAVAAEGRQQLELVGVEKAPWLPVICSVLEANTELLQLQLPWKDATVESLLGRNRRLAIVASGIEGLWAPALAHYQSGDTNTLTNNLDCTYNLLRWGWVTGANGDGELNDQNGDNENN